MNTQQQVILRESHFESILFLNGNSNSKVAASTINQLNDQPGITSVEPSTDHPSMIEVRFNKQQTRGHKIVRSIHDKNKRWTCVTFLYCKSGEGDDFQQHVIQAITEQPGVIAAERSVIKGYAFMVHFDQREIKASQIVNKLRKQGYSALLFGC